MMTFRGRGPKEARVTGEAAASQLEAQRALSVRCPQCGAAEGARCRDTSGEVADAPHLRRRKRAEVGW